MSDYQEFLEAKIELANENKVSIDWQIEREFLKGHQLDSATWALNRGAALIAAKFGLGKTRIQITIAKALHAHTGQPFMLLPPKVTRSDEDMVWDNVEFMGNLNARQVRQGAASHLCPLPFDICERIIKLYSNEGDIVFDPFGGLGTVPYCAVKLKRFGLSCELALDYYNASVRYLQAIEREVSTPSLFDLLELKSAA